MVNSSGIEPPHQKLILAMPGILDEFKFDHLKINRSSGYMCHMYLYICCVCVYVYSICAITDIVYTYPD